MLADIDGHASVAEVTDILYQMGDSAAIVELRDGLICMLLDEQLYELSDKTKEALENNSRLSIDLIQGLDRMLQDNQDQFDMYERNLAVLRQTVG